jgi:hypothetical protein
MDSSTLLEPTRWHNHWDVQEGSAREIAPKLRNSDAHALVFVSHGIEDSRTRIKFEALKQAYELIEELIHAKEGGQWKALIDALTPEIPLTPNRVVEARMFAQAMREILEGSDFVRAADIADVAHFSKTNPSSRPNRWKKAGQIFAVPYKGVDLYPLYALELKEGAKPLPVMSDILKILSAKDDWGKAFWFGSVNTYLQNKMPKELLKSKPREVLRAAEIEAAGVQHG